MVGLILYISKQFLHHLIDIGIGLAKARIGLHFFYFLDCFDCFSIWYITTDFKGNSVFADSFLRKNIESSCHGHAYISTESFKLPL